MPSDQPADHAQSTAQSASHAESIGRFRVVRQLGRGGEGIVYLARDPKLDRDVAIKTLLLGDASDKNLAEQLIETASTASALSHPNIVPVFKAGMHEGCPYVVCSNMWTAPPSRKR